MEMERRGWVIWPYCLVNQRWQLDDKSRMNRDVHVRICEGLGVKFPRATRLFRTAHYVKVIGPLRSLYA
ncbi:MAG: hypothetical protein ABSH06_12000 [Thermodesulfobacteriota bacterium]